VTACRGDVCEHPRILIRRDDPTDHAAVRTVVADAFEDQAPPGGPPVEIALVDALRASSEWIPQLSLVAESDERTVVGYVICTRGWVDGRPALGLGPLAVAPAAQRRGTGSALMHAVLGAADALEEPLVALLGHTEYYPRFGFRPAAQLGVVPPVAAWASHFQVRTLTAYQPDLRGTFRYARPFDDL
jgi:putative acetyltransferase